MATASNNVGIVDLRGQSVPGDENGISDIRQEIIQGLSFPAGEKKLPTLLLYDERGLRLYDEITTKAPEYYLFAAEEEILKNSADDIVQLMHGMGGQNISGEVVVELGAGALRKTSHILRALSHLSPSIMETPPVTYYALDLEKTELERTLSLLADSDVGAEIQGKVTTKGLCATYDDGLKFIQGGGLDNIQPLSLNTSVQYKLEHSTGDVSPSSTSSRSRSDFTEMTPPSTPGAEQPPLHLLFLGSSLGNFARGEDAAFLRSLPLRPGSGSTLLLGLDHDNDPEQIESAYNDTQGITKAFIMNGLKGAGRALGDESLFDIDKWEYVGKYNEEARRHEAFYRSKGPQVIIDPSTQNPISFLKDELVHIEVSHKYSDKDAFNLFSEANLRPVNRWTDSSNRYSLWLLERPTFTFPLLKVPSVSEGRSPFGMPTIEEWKDMWAAWDFINRRMIPTSMLFEKPIDLRHICLFYQGHIPTFLDIHLSRLLQEPHTHPEDFKYIFERGIDPIVDDPTQCHPHSEVPQSNDEWPTHGAILLFQSKVRERLIKLYERISSGNVTLTRKIARVLFMTLEHEAFHAETLLYMLLQRAGTGTIPPQGFIPPQWSILASQWDLAPRPPSSTVTLGPAIVSLGHDDDEADDLSTDIVGHEFGWDNEHPRRDVQVDEFRIEWRPVTNGEFFTFYKSADHGQVQFPASWVEIEGGIQVRTLYGPVPMKVAQDWPIITSYDNLSTYASVKGGRIPTEPELRLFLDKFECGYEGGANMGFRNWHPIPATTGGGRNGGRGHNGGVWEWTSTVLEKYDGFVPSRLYPGYSTDFFDNHHQVVIGGSYATIPRLAERRSLRNYYQHNYPYAWVGARIAYDV
ncbi:EgtD Methyltransferase Superfamily protein [Abortiporus biennis]